MPTATSPGSWSSRPAFCAIERRALVLVSLLIAATRTGFALVSDRHLFATVYGDDAFYSLNVARHLALGHGFSADGVHATNGVQPLITLLQSLCFLVVGGDLFGGVRASFILSAAIEIGFVWSLARLIRLLQVNSDPPTHWYLSAPVIAGCMQLVVFALIAQFTNGLETGLYSLLLTLTLTQYARILSVQDSPLRCVLMLGVYSGLLILSRIDATVFVGIMCGFLLLRDRSIRRPLIIGLVGLAISSPWWLYGIAVFGSPMPISGQAESLRAMPPDAISKAFIALTDILFFFIHTWGSPIPLWAYAGGACLIASVLFVVSRRIGIISELKGQYRLSNLLPLAFFCIFLEIFYTFFFRAPWFMPRYFQPIRLLWQLLLACGIPIVLTRVIDGKVLHQSLLFGIRAGLVTCIIGICGFNLLAYRSMFRSTRESDFGALGFWAREHADSRIGMMQSGTAGFISSNITNLDGKVNFEALKALKADTLGEYIRTQHFDYLTDWPDCTDTMVTAAARAGVRYALVDSIHSIRIYKRM